MEERVAPAAPHDATAEFCLVGGLLIDPGLMPEVAAVLGPGGGGHIWGTLAGRIYCALEAVLAEGGPYDVVLVLSRLRAQPDLDQAEVVDLVSRMIADTPTAATAVAHARAVLAYSRRRAVLAAGTRLGRALVEGQAVAGELEAMRTAIDGLAAAIEAPRLQTPITAGELAALDYGGIDWIVEPFWARDQICQLQGEPKGGKSCFALYCAIAAASGVWGAGRWRVARPQTILFVTWEDSARRLQSRVRQYCAGLGIAPPPTLLILGAGDGPRITLTRPSGADALRLLAERTGAAGVVLDTFSHLCEGDENSKEHMQPVLNSLRDVSHAGAQPGLLVIHHTGKPGQGQERSTAYKGRGSSAIAAAYDAILDFGAKVEPDVTLCKLISKDVPADEFHLVYDKSRQDQIIWSMESPTPVERASETRGKVMRVLRDYLKTASAIDRTTLGALTGYSEDTIRYQLARLVKDEILLKLRVGDGRHSRATYSFSEEFKGGEHA